MSRASVSAWLAIATLDARGVAPDHWLGVPPEEATLTGDKGRADEMGRGLFGSPELGKFRVEPGGGYLVRVDLRG